MVKLSERGEIRVGFRCNARCGFCYYQELLDNPVEKEPTSEQIARQLRALRRMGATEIEFTGGEPTIRPDLVDLIADARKLGFVNISIITNGLRLSKRQYADKLVGAGANDFLFSIHGQSAAIHDRHTSIPGSFAKIIEAVRNVQAAGARCRGTTTVTGMNSMHLVEIVGKLIELDMSCIHLAVFSPVAQAGGTDPEMMLTYSEAAAGIKAAIDFHRGNLPPLSVKYIPFCFMVGYEQHVMNLYQQSFDPDDWNYYFSNKVRRANGLLMRISFDALVSGGYLLAKDRSVPKRYGWAGRKVFGLTRLVELLRKKRPAACRACRYDIVCDHVWKQYTAHFGEDELVTVPGEKIKDPAWCYELARYRLPGVPVAETCATPKSDGRGKPR